MRLIFLFLMVFASVCFPSQRASVNVLKGKLGNPFLDDRESSLGLWREDFDRLLFDGAPFPLQASLGSLSWRLGETELPGMNHWWLTYQPYLLLPVDAENWDSDWVASARQSLRLRYAPTAKFKFSIRESIVSHLYRDGGYVNSYGPRASRVFENRVKVMAEVAIWKEKIYFSFPVTLKQVKHANYRDGARFNNRWRHSVWIHPDITYYFSGNSYVSLMYESDTFINSSFDKFYFTESLAAGGVSAWVSLVL